MAIQFFHGLADLPGAPVQPFQALRQQRPLPWRQLWRQLSPAEGQARQGLRVVGPGELGQVPQILEELLKPTGVPRFFGKNQQATG